MPKPHLGTAFRYSYRLRGIVYKVIDVLVLRIIPSTADNVGYDQHGLPGDTSFRSQTHEA